MKPPELNWRPMGEGGNKDFEMLLSSVAPQHCQDCVHCNVVCDESSDRLGWGLLIECMARKKPYEFSTSYFCPECLDKELISRNRMSECKADGVKDPSACATEKGKREGDEDHK